MLSISFRKPTTLTRILAILVCVLYFFSFFFRDLFWTYFDEDFQRILIFNGFSSLFDSDLLAYALIFVYGISHLGVILSSIWGLNLVVLYYALVSIASIFSGLIVLHPIEVLIGWAILFLDLAIMYNSLEKS